ncbi:DUF2563 family protein [Streptomyces sp. NBC_00249]|uniref:DUF2563 family protein n=1 Tax=Streptomyces sp. NBC_00249 TaxID=2975690 RepID=UPI00224EC3C8|nr:DUF2563 family protein [Streptomyces sp. NBC_00249]MCX5199622.1 DUF2563 family protein [Streptomyces sp. NBC_00249]
MATHLAGDPPAAALAEALRSQAGALAVEYQAMSDYKRTVDDLLRRLEGSEADGRRLAHGTLPTGTLGRGFAEADALFTAYGTVHTELQKLSRALAGQIEALGIAVLTAGKGYAEVDEATQDRMRTLIRGAKQNSTPPTGPSPSPSTSGGSF